MEKGRGSSKKTHKAITLDQFVSIMAPLIDMEKVRTTPIYIFFSCSFNNFTLAGVAFLFCVIIKKYTGLLD